MGKLSKYYHSWFVFIVAFSIVACEPSAIIYKRDYSQEEQTALAESLLNGAGTDLYYQGSVGERMIIFEGMKYSPDNAWGHREIGVPYLKRGFAMEAFKYYDRAIQADPEEWLGYKAYCWLYFYRDYAMALDEITTFDAFTPDFVDYPQSTSVNYMRGICLLHLGRLEEASHYLKKHLDMEMEDVGVEYVEALAFLSLGMSYHLEGRYVEADSIFSLGLSENESTSDLHYYKAKNLIELGELDLAKQSLERAQHWYSKGAKNTRPYVEEFFAIYQEDLDRLTSRLQ